MYMKKSTTYERIIFLCVYRELPSKRMHRKTENSLCIHVCIEKTVLTSDLVKLLLFQKPPLSSNTYTSKFVCGNYRAGHYPPHRLCWPVHCTCTGWRYRWDVFRNERCYIWHGTPTWVSLALNEFLNLTRLNF